MRARILVAAATASLIVSSSAQAALIIQQTTDIAAGAASFGPVSTGLTWANFFPSGTMFAAGNYQPEVHGFSKTDPTTGASVSGNLSIGNYIDGTGFDDNGPAPDLALNGPENFTLSFASAVSRVGFAAATGAGSFPSEFNHLGATFTVTTNTGEAGILNLIDAGSGLRAYVTISAANPFTSISFSEPSGDLHDQYFGNVVAGPAAVPEPASWAMFIGGFGTIGVAMRRRRSVAFG